MDLATKVSQNCLILNFTLIIGRKPKCNTYKNKNLKDLNPVVIISFNKKRNFSFKKKKNEKRLMVKMYKFYKTMNKKAITIRTKRRPNLNISHFGPQNNEVYDS